MQTRGTAGVALHGSNLRSNRQPEVASAKADAAAAWAWYGTHPTGTNLRACFSAEAALRRRYDVATGSVVRMARAVPLRRSGGRARRPAMA